MNIAFQTRNTTLPRPASLKPTLDTLNFDLPPALEASEPPEARGLKRDEVRLMVSYRVDDRIVHGQFYDLPDFLKAGDVLVINTSGTLNAALNVTRAEDGQPLETASFDPSPGGLWVVEVRQIEGGTTKPFYTATPGTILNLPGGAKATLHTPHSACERQQPGHTRLWIATLNLPDDVREYLAEYGFPIRYSYVRESWPGSYYQTAYATEMGSAEMPSAGRAFTPELMTKLAAKGVQIAPLILHTGVASLETHEPPYEEYYRVPAETAEIVNAAREAGRRIIAVGTTVVRALETVTNERGETYPGEGWTGVIITPQRGIRAVNALLTGLHEPRATHLAMLEALASRDHLAVAYNAALAEKYLWHEFGDLHLILP